MAAQIARFMEPTWSPPGSCQPQMGPMLAPWILLSGLVQDGSTCCANALGILHFWIKPSIWSPCAHFIAFHTKGLFQYKDDIASVKTLLLQMDGFLYICKPHIGMCVSAEMYNLKNFSLMIYFHIYCAAQLTYVDINVAISLFVFYFRLRNAIGNEEHIIWYVENPSWQ